MQQIQKSCIGGIKQNFSGIEEQHFHDKDLKNSVALSNKMYFYSVVLPLKIRRAVFFLQFILTFRLAIDARLHQKNRTQGGKPALSESSKNNS